MARCRKDRSKRGECLMSFLRAVSNSRLLASSFRADSQSICLPVLAISSTRIDSTSRRAISKQQVAIARSYPGNEAKCVACVVGSYQCAHITSLHFAKSIFRFFRFYIRVSLPLDRVIGIVPEKFRPAISSSSLKCRGGKVASLGTTTQR